MHPFRSAHPAAGPDEISATHEVLMRDIGRLVDATDAETATSCLARLRRVLLDHFQLEEERDGILDWIVMLDASMGDRVQALIADHEALRAECEALHSPFRADGSVDEEAMQAVRAFAEHMRGHEAAERLAMERVREAAAGPQRTTRTTASEHVHLRQRFEQLERAATAPGLLAVLDALMLELAPHFAMEEAANGTFEELGRSLPHAAATIETLRAEHGLVLARVDELAAQVRDLGDAPIQPLLTSASQLAAALRYHEQVEGRLIQEAAYNEFGDGD